MPEEYRNTIQGEQHAQDATHVLSACFFQGKACQRRGQNEQRNLEPGNPGLPGNQQAKEGNSRKQVSPVSVCGHMPVYADAGQTPEKQNDMQRVLGIIFAC